MPHYTLFIINCIERSNMILLTGANGQLGTDFKKILDNKNTE